MVAPDNMHLITTTMRFWRFDSEEKYSMKSINDEFLNISAASEYLEISPNTLRNWSDEGEVPVYRHPINNYRLFRLCDLEQLRERIQSPQLEE